MQRNTKSELPGGSGLGDISLLRLSMTMELKASLHASVEVAQSFRYDAAGGVCVYQWNNLWFRCYPKYTQMWYCTINYMTKWKRKPVSVVETETYFRFHGGNGNGNLFPLQKWIRFHFPRESVCGQQCKQLSRQKKAGRSTHRGQTRADLPAGIKKHFPESEVQYSNNDPKLYRCCSSPRNET